MSDQHESAETREGRNGGTFIPWLDKWVCRWCFDLNNLAALKACPGAHHDGERET